MARRRLNDKSQQTQAVTMAGSLSDRGLIAASIVTGGLEQTRKRRHAKRTTHAQLPTSKNKSHTHEHTHPHKHTHARTPHAQTRTHTPTHAHPQTHKATRLLGHFRQVAPVDEVVVLDEDGAQIAVAQRIVPAHGRDGETASLTASSRPINEVRAEGDEESTMRLLTNRHRRTLATESAVRQRRRNSPNPPAHRPRERESRDTGP